MYTKLPPNFNPHQEHLIYLASPFNHADPQVMDTRRNKACYVAAAMQDLGLTVYAPIPQNHTIRLNMRTPEQLTHDAWLRRDLVILSRCTHLTVLCLGGWQHSKGVADEMEFCRNNNIPTLYLPQSAHSHTLAQYTKHSFGL